MDPFSTSSRFDTQGAPSWLSVLILERPACLAGGSIVDARPVQQDRRAAIPQTEALYDAIARSLYSVADADLS